MLWCLKVHYRKQTGANLSLSLVRSASLLKIPQSLLLEERTCTVLIHFQIYFQLGRPHNGTYMTPS